MRLAYLSSNYSSKGRFVVMELHLDKPVHEEDMTSLAIEELTVCELKFQFIIDEHSVC
jgi:hypothetical protein